VHCDFPKHKRNWLLFIREHLNCPFVIKQADFSPKAFYFLFWPLVFGDGHSELTPPYSADVKNVWSYASAPPYFTVCLVKNRNITS
jgi:hypothetical protein